jgi:hypothetical protein
MEFANATNTNRKSGAAEGPAVSAISTCAPVLGVQRIAKSGCHMLLGARRVPSNIRGGKGIAVRVRHQPNGQRLSMLSRFPQCEVDNFPVISTGRTTTVLFWVYAAQGIAAARTGLHHAAGCDREFLKQPPRGATALRSGCKPCAKFHRADRFPISSSVLEEVPVRERNRSIHRQSPETGSRFRRGYR